MMPGRTDWSGSRRTLLGIATGLWLSTRLPQESMATPVPTPVTGGLRDFAYVCAALILAGQEQADLEPLADVRYQQAYLLLTPEATVAQLAYPEDVAEGIFAAGATQLYAYVALNQDQSRALVVNLVEATTPDGAETIFQAMRQLVPQPDSRSATSEEAPDADSSFVGKGYGAQNGIEQYEPRNWVFGGVRFGRLVAIWQVGFQPETPDPALTAPINRVLRDYLRDQDASSRRGASLAFLLTIPEQPRISIVQTMLDGTVLGYWNWDAAEIARRQALAARLGIVNELNGSFHGPDRLILNTIIDELATAEQAGQYMASLRRDQPAIDQRQGMTRRLLGADEFSLTGWDDWQASAILIQQGDHSALGVDVVARLGTFLVYVEALDDTSGEAASAPPGRGHDALREWSAIAYQLLAPMPAVARHPPDAVARAVFPPPLPAFADPLASQG